jgi:ubiquinone/menaquinone biosynthesis C-methylase UbiE
MQNEEIRRQWEDTAPGWAHWEATISTWMEPATEAMFDMAGLGAGKKVLDLASGAGSQTLKAARMVGELGQVLASDISDTMLHHVQENARAAGLSNISIFAGAAEDLDLPAESFDAAICRLGLMLFAAPEQALATAHQALKPRGKFACVVFTTPGANPFMAKPLQILLRHAGKPAPAPGQPGIFALGGPGRMEQLMKETGFVDVEQRALAVPLRMPSAAHTLVMMQDAFGAYRAVVNDRSELVRGAAWAEVAEFLKTFETATGFVAPAEVLVAAGRKPA